MVPRNELEQLMSGLLDGPGESSGSGGKARLAALLREHPEFVAEYVDHLQLHALLHWRGGTVVPGMAAAEPLDRELHRQATVVRIRRRMPRPLTAIAAVLAIALGIALLWPPPEAQARPDVVEHLVDWNLELSEAAPLSERQAIYEDRVVELRELLTMAELPPDERALADQLLETGSWLATNADPVAEAERFGDLAERVAAQLETASTADDAGRASRLADAYHRLMVEGVSPSLERARQAAPTDPRIQVRLERVAAGGTNRAKKLADVLVRHPPSGRKPTHPKKPHSRKTHPAP